MKQNRRRSRKVARGTESFSVQRASDDRTVTITATAGTGETVKYRVYRDPLLIPARTIPAERTAAH